MAGTYYGDRVVRPSGPCCHRTDVGDVVMVICCGLLATLWLDLTPGQIEAGSPDDQLGNASTEVVGAQ